MTYKPTITFSWSHAFTITIDGDPVPKGRPRSARTKDGIRTYTDEKTAAYENKVAWLARQKTRGRMLADNGVPVRVDVLAQHKRTKALLKPSAPDGLIPKTSRTGGDADNHLKAILDGLEKANVFKNDAQCCCLRIDAVYADKPENGGRPCSLVRVYLPTDILEGMNK